MLKQFLLLLISLFFVIQCSLPEPDDLTSPVVVVIYPYEGAVINENFDIRVEANDDEALEKVWIYFDGEKKGESTNSTYIYTLDIEPYRDNLIHVIQAGASDESGNTGYSEQVTFTIADTAGTNANE